MLCLAVMVSLPVWAQGGKELPRVLVIGDTVYSQHARGMANDLKGRAEVVIAAWPEGSICSGV